MVLSVRGNVGCCVTRAMHGYTLKLWRTVSRMHVPTCSVSLVASAGSQPKSLGQEKKKSNTGAIVGGILGAGSLMLIVASAAFLIGFLLRRNAPQKKDPPAGPPHGAAQVGFLVARTVAKLIVERHGISFVGQTLEITLQYPA
jgi:hypothetical protein